MKFILNRINISSKIMLLSLLFFGSAKQILAQQVSYKIIYDDPLDVKNLFVSLSPFYVDLGATGNLVNTGFVLQGNYNLGKRLAFEASYANAYLDGNARNGKKITGTSDLLSKHKQIEAGAAFFFRNKIKQKTVQVTLSGNQSSSTYINIPAKVNVQSGLRGGVFYYNYAIVTEENEHFVGTNPNTNKDTSLSTFEYKGIATNMNVAGGYVGLIRRKTIDISIQAGSYGKKSTSKIKELYVDLLYAPIVNFSDVIVSQELKYTNGPAIKYDLSSTPKRNVGWRVGYQVIMMKWYMQYRMELGQKPGWGLKSGYYFNASWALNFGFKTKASKPILATTEN